MSSSLFGSFYHDLLSLVSLSLLSLLLGLQSHPRGSWYLIVLPDTLWSSLIFPGLPWHSLALLRIALNDTDYYRVTRGVPEYP